MGGGRTFLLLDASVLIDFCTADETILSLSAAHLGEILVASTILAEVDGLDQFRAETLGMRVVEPTLEILAAAHTRERALSFEDQTLLLLAKSERWTCVTNDKPLRRACEREGVAMLWGFEILIQLVDVGALPRSDARDLGERIARSNRMIGPEVLARFIDRLRG